MSMLPSSRHSVFPTTESSARTRASRFAPTPSTSSTTSISTVAASLPLSPVQRSVRRRTPLVHARLNFGRASPSKVAPKGWSFRPPSIFVSVTKDATNSSGHIRINVRASSPLPRLRRSGGSFAGLLLSGRREWRDYDGLDACHRLKPRYLNRWNQNTRS
jgi:hypothetical protein